MTTITLEIPELEKVGSSAHVEKALEAIPHVSSVEIDGGQAKVEHDGAVCHEDLRRALRAIGYHDVRDRIT